MSLAASLPARGVFAAALTPLDADLSPDLGAFARHCRWLLDHGCDGLAILGTTGEANSFSVEERLTLMEAAVAAGIPAARLLPGTGCCAFPDTLRLTRRALALGTLGVLMLPPFYYKNVSEDGLFAAYAEVIERVGDAALRLFLYNFPAMSAVPIPFAVIERLMRAYPGTIAGIKDSSADLDYMTRLIRAFPGFAVFSGSDRSLLALLREGGAGIISSGTNIACALAAEVQARFRAGDAAGAEAAQGRLNAVRELLAATSAIPALKAVHARARRQPGLRHVRPPLTELAPEAEAAFLAALDAAGFALPPP